MVLPPNLIQAFAEVRDYNTVIQVRSCGTVSPEAAAADGGLVCSGALQRAPVGAALQR